jgi:hypothetical protein
MFIYPGGWKYDIIFKTCPTYGGTPIDTTNGSRQEECARKFGHENWGRNRLQRG